MTEQERAAISNELRAKEVTASTQFYRAIEDALGRYDAHYRLHATSKPSKTRENLKLARNAALDLNETLNNLDGNAMQLLHEARPGGIESIRVHVRQIIQHLSETQALADEYPHKGSLPQYPRLYLAADIAAAIARHTDTMPEPKDGGLFAGLQYILLDSQSRELRERALAVDRFEQYPGLVEYRPPLK